MADAGELTLEIFAERVGDPFRIRASGELTLETRLLEATAVSAVPSPAGRVPFSLIFRGPGQPILPQRIYRLEHDALGDLDLFLVPLAPDADGARYQAVFA
jgi:Domain of unknown function (DUF6916)